MVGLKYNTQMGCITRPQHAEFAYSALRFSACGIIASLVWLVEYSLLTCPGKVTWCLMLQKDTVMGVPLLFLRRSGHPRVWVTITPNKRCTNAFKFPHDGRQLYSGEYLPHRNDQR